LIEINLDRLEDQILCTFDSLPIKGQSNLDSPFVLADNLILDVNIINYTNNLLSFYSEINKDTIKIALNFRKKIGNNWIPVFRCDNAHGKIHIDYPIIKDKVIIPELNSQDCTIYKLVIITFNEFMNYIQNDAEFKINNSDFTGTV